MRTKRMSLADVLQQLGASGPQTTSSSRPPIVEAEIATLREHAARYAAPSPWRVGDVVKYRQGMPVVDRAMGHPMVVVEVRDASRLSVLDSNYMPVRWNVRLLSMDDEGDILAVWTEGWQLELWDSPSPVADEEMPS